MAAIRDVLVKRTEYSLIIDPAELRQYVVDVVGLASPSALYMNPNIATAVYTALTNAANAITSATDAYGISKTDANRDAIPTKMSLAVDRLNEFCDLVEPIANDPANRTTREEAKVNIEKANLKAQKLDASPKPDPEKAVATFTNVGTGKVVPEITNGAEYAPTKTNYILVEGSSGTDASDPIITLDGDMVKVTMFKPGDIHFISAAGRGTDSLFPDLKPGVGYVGVAFGQNTKNSVGELSDPVNVKG